MLSLLKKGPSANKVPAEKIQATYGRYRMQALLSVFLGYLAYYIVRNNFTLSTPYLKEQLDLSATQIGLLSSCMLIAYGISKGVMSSLADKASPKVFMACGLVLCAIVNVGLGFSTAFWVFAALVVLNGLFQGMGIGMSYYYADESAQSPSDEENARAIRELIDDGYIQQILLSQDVFLKTMLTRYGGHGYGYILKHFVPRLRRHGVSGEQLETLMIGNPQRVFGG
ncbi:MFS transporter [Klebsiella pneumoniae]